MVRTPQPLRRLSTPVHGLAEVELRTTDDPTCHGGFWLIGVEDEGPQSSGELCVCELFGTAMRPGRTGVNVGLKVPPRPAPAPGHEGGRARHRRDRVAHPLRRVGCHGRALYIDDGLVRSVGQAIDYALQLLIDLFEFS